MKVDDDTTVHLESKLHRFRVPGDKMTSHIQLAWAVADHEELPRSVMSWPSGKFDYQTGDLAKAFGMAPSAENDAEALNNIDKGPSESSQQEWGGCFEGCLEDLFEDGEYRRLKDDYYINVVAPTVIAKQFEAINEGKVIIKNVGPGSSRVLGGHYPHSSKPIIPPLRLVNLVFNKEEVCAPESAPDDPCNTAAQAVHITPTVCETVPAALNSDIRAFSNESLKGEPLRLKLSGGTLTKLASMASKSVRKQKLLVFKCHAWNPEETFGDVCKMIYELSGSSNSIAAFLFKQVEQIFCVDFDSRTCLVRSSTE
jgi:hypothetical protein